MRHPRPAPRLFGIALATSLCAGICLPAVSVLAANGAHGFDAAQSAAASTVIVRTATGSARNVASTIREVGGNVTHRLRSVDSFVAHVPAGAISRLSAAPGVESVTPDRQVTLSSSGPDGTNADELGSLSSVASSIGADDFWRAGYLGKGVDVAVIDSGVSPVKGLDSAGQAPPRPRSFFRIAVGRPRPLRHLRPRYEHGRDHRGQRHRGRDGPAGLRPIRYTGLHGRRARALASSASRSPTPSETRTCPR